MNRIFLFSRAQKLIFINFFEQANVRNMNALDKVTSAFNNDGGRSQKEREKKTERERAYIEEKCVSMKQRERERPERVRDGIEEII